MSKTLKELFENHGSVWLAKEETPNKKYFKPLGYAEDSYYIIGEVNTDTRSVTVTYFGVGLDVLVLYVEKEEIYEYALLDKLRDDEGFINKQIMIMTEEEHRDFTREWPLARVVKLRGPF